VRGAALVFLALEELLKLEHSFTVPADLDTVWQAVLDPERVTPCMPGATLTEVDGDAFKGSVKVKMGPISLLYKGTGEFLAKDADANTVVIKASGKDARGNGTASATVTVTLTASGDSTVGSVQTDLSITGKPAQFGRGLISEVGGKILNSFATCLASKLAPATEEPPKLTVVEEAADEPVSAEAAVTTAAEKTAAPTATPPPKTADTKQHTDAKAATQHTDEKETAQHTEAKAAARDAEAEETARHAEAKETGKQAGETTAAHSHPAAKPRLAAAPEPETEPIDLLAYAGPSVLKRVAPLMALVAAVLAFIALRRRR
jgi:uncharacterized protein